MNPFPKNRDSFLTDLRLALKADFYSRHPPFRISTGFVKTMKSNSKETHASSFI